MVVVVVVVVVVVAVVVVVSVETCCYIATVVATGIATPRPSALPGEYQYSVQSQ